MNLLAGQGRGQEASRESRLFPIGFFNAVMLPSGLFICLSDINFKQIVFSHLFPHYIYSKTFWKENGREYLPHLKEPGGLQSKGHQGVGLNHHLPVSWALHGLLLYFKSQFQASSLSPMENVLSLPEITKTRNRRHSPLTRRKKLHQSLSSPRTSCHSICFPFSLPFFVDIEPKNQTVFLLVSRQLSGDTWVIGFQPSLRGGVLFIR